MKINIKVNKDQMVALGNGAKKVGKEIVFEGTKAVVLKGVMAVVTQSFDGGLGSVKELSMDDVLKGGKKHNKPAKEKKRLFNFKKKSIEEVTNYDLSDEEGIDEMIDDLTVMKKDIKPTKAVKK